MEIHEARPFTAGKSYKTGIYMPNGYFLPGQDVLCLEVSADRSKALFQIGRKKQEYLLDQNDIHLVRKDSQVTAYRCESAMRPYATTPTYDQYFVIWSTDIIDEE